MNNIILQLAWRNLWRQRHRTWMTVGAMVFSNSLLVFSISLQFGSYDMMINNTLQAFSGHLQIQHPRYLDDPKIRYALPQIIATTRRLRSELSLNSISARAAGFVLASSHQRSFGLQIVGVDPVHEPLVSTVPGFVREGRYLEPGKSAEIVIGSVLARNLKVTLGDEITLLGSGYDASFVAVVVQVVGIFESGMNELDRAVAEINLPYFQSIFAMRGKGHSIVIRAPNIDQVAPLQTRIRKLLPPADNLVVRDWATLQPGLKQAIQADMTSAWFMYIVLVILVVLSVMNTQLMSVLERTREFGTMMALGLQPGRLSRLVLMETAMMSALGLGLGLVIGGAITGYLGLTGFSYPGMEEMAVKFNLPDRMYPHLSFTSLLLGPTVVVIGSLLVAFYPALRLYTLRPVDAMRAV